MSSVGSYLRELRESKGVSLDEIARATRVAPRYLEALEADQHSALPEPPFTRGFIRAYCQVLSEPPDVALARYTERDSIPTPAAPVVGTRPAEREGGRSRRTIVVSFVLLVVLGAALLALAVALRSGRERDVQVAATPLPSPESRAPRPASAPAPAPTVEAPEKSAGAAIATPGVGASTAPTRLTPAPTAAAAGLSATTGSTSATESSTRPEAPVSASAAATAAARGAPRVVLETDPQGKGDERSITYTARVWNASGDPLANAEVSLHAWMPDGSDLEARLSSTSTPGTYRGTVEVGVRTPGHLRVGVAHGGKTFEIAPQRLQH